MISTGLSTRLSTTVDVNVSLVVNPTDSVAPDLSLAENETKTPSQGATTEAPDALKGMKTPGQTAMKGLFNEETVQHEPKTPNQVSNQMCYTFIQLSF